MDYRIFLYIFFGILPSLTWLLYYLRKDSHPEPKRMILAVFLSGAAVTVPVFAVQVGLSFLLNEADAAFGVPRLVFSFVYWFFIISFIEEIFKFFVVRLKVYRSPALDEPLDIMLYMVISALGFAALENILYLFMPAGQLSFSELVNRTLMVTFIRFIGATFLHTLCSAIFGYFIAISFYQPKYKKLIFFLGLLLATLLHGLYDFSIMTITGPGKIIIPAAILLILAFLVVTGFEKLKKMKSVGIIKS